MASMAITEQTPKIIPNTVRLERSLRSLRLLMPICTIRMGWARDMMVSKSQAVIDNQWVRQAKAITLQGGAPHRWIDNLVINQAVLHFDDAVGARGDFVVVGDEHDGFSFGIET